MTDRIETAPDPVRFTEATMAYDRTPALTLVDGRVPAGQAVALVGPNGGGKSTLIKAVLGLVPVVAGAVTVAGRRPAAAREFVGYVPQAANLDPEFPVTARQVVLMGRYRLIGRLRRPGRRDRAAADEALARVGLADRANARFGALSGGQRQRVLLARALSAQPPILVLDEPFNGVDAVSQEALIEALVRAKDAGTAVLVSTHDLAVAQRLCEQTCLVNRRQFAFADTESALTPELLCACYGGQVLELDAGRLVVTPG
ncbi:metal ABC transporter ATP-binding protein [Embleya scabrispora]|uniref:metal ABC transporter ATP-binding protein n=1 Tax=Embleya scabrispora TaxID=159449 RepID=UPI00036AB4AC|nr:metal ABC transporter ATP-binding protein [Embleya scabrispora]MYS87974.1 ATP-binding cassette domain-containing protein [Streptomyces sp. SID5474]